MASLLIQTLGCKLNQLESESFTDAFRQAGFSLYTPADKSSPLVVIVNTCTVTSKTDQKARRVIRKALRDFPLSCVFVTGCYAQLNYCEIEKLDTDKSGRLFVLKGKDKEKLLDLPAFLNEGNNIYEAVNLWYLSSRPSAPLKTFQFAPEKFSSHTRGLLKIQDGCDNHCTYCRIRLARGKSISLDAETALARLRILEKNNAEAVLTGVNIGQYCDKSCSNLGELLDFLLSGTAKIALRLSSLAPNVIDESLAKILSNKRIRAHFHLSVQSCSEKILEKMGRSYNGKTVEKAVSLLRGAKDDPFLACDIITGFPGETEDEFVKTYRLCEKIDFAWIHVFPYSKRPGTAAFSFTDVIQEKEVSKRVGMFTDLAWLGRKNYVCRWLGRDTDVLVEKGSTDELFFRGVSDNYLKLLVQFKGKTPPPPGTVLRCRINTDQEIDCNKDYDAVAQEL